MIYISAQPAETYFLWQLELQLQNFEEIGIPPQQIHVLLAYTESFGVPESYTNLLNSNKATFFCYPDTRIEQTYVSSIRPHILQKHFVMHPNLQSETIFYHDSDIFFRERINESLFEQDNIWYMSDTRTYLSASHLISFGEDLLAGLCQSINIDPKIVIKNEANTGGAQYILKNISANYWLEVEINSTIIFNYLKKYINQHPDQDYELLQIWCADMWAVLWTAWKHNIQTKIHQELDFCWPKSHISAWYNSKILHNSGVSEKEQHNYFCKGVYHQSSPYFVDFSALKKDTCSMILTDKILQHSFQIGKHDLQQFTIVIHSQRFGFHSQKNIETYIRFLKKELNTTVILVENGEFARFNYTKIDSRLLDAYYFIGTENISKILEQSVQTDYFLYTDSDLILSSSQIIAASERLMANPQSFVRPYQSIKNCHLHSFENFKNRLDFKVLKVSKNNEIQLPFIESYMLRKDSYLVSGGENLDWTYYVQTGINLERESRMRILGFKIIHIDTFAYQICQDNIHQISELSDETNYLRRIYMPHVAQLKNEISLLNYSHPCSITREHRQLDLPIQINIFNTYRDDNYTHLQQQFADLSIFEMERIDQVFDQNKKRQQWNSIIQSIEKHDFNKQAIYVLCTDNFAWTEAYDPKTLISTIDEMLELQLDYVNTGSVGGFEKVKQLSEHLVWIDNCFSMALVLLSENMCRRMLNASYDGVQEIDVVCSELTNLKALSLPYLTKYRYHNYAKTKPQVDFHDSTDIVDHIFKTAENKLKYYL